MPEQSSGQGSGRCLDCYAASRSAALANEEALDKRRSAFRKDNAAYTSPAVAVPPLAPDAPYRKL